MANTVVTSTTNAIKVDFGDDPNKGSMTKATYAKLDIEFVLLNENHVEVVAADSQRWILSHESNTINALIIDHVDGVGPTNLNDLYDKISALIE